MPDSCPSILLAGAIGYRPLSQGSLDGLCGLYAALNAIRVIAAPFRPIRPSEAKHLFDFGVRWLDHRRVLAKTLTDGMSIKRQRSLMQEMVGEVCALTGHEIMMQKLALATTPSNRLRMFRTIENRLQQGAAVVVCLQNHHNHFTVVVGCSVTRFYLADSDGLHWLPKTHFGPCKGQEQFRNCINIKDATEIMRNHCRCHEDGKLKAP